jgi:glycosyltransferase involved in cell wall biosynthesis
MRFCMVTTFFGPHGFGGDAVYVDRLTRALLKRGHEVSVVYSVDAFRAAGGRSERPYDRPPGLRLHALKSRAGVLAPLWSQQTGHPPPRSQLARIVAEGGFDVVHFHNSSLMGAPAALEVGEGGPLRLLSAHEHWLVCPMHILWKYDREVCERPQCISCSLRGRRLPQLWRYTGLRDRALATLDAVICGSEAMIENHRARGIRVPMTHLPTFVPEEWAARAVPRSHSRPYLVLAGRLIKAKGQDEVIPLMRRLKGVDLLIAGDGPYEGRLRRLAEGLDNVHLLGRLEGPELAGLLAGARAAVVPSRCHEAFANVPLEAFGVGTPVVARRHGALQEAVERTGGGLLYTTEGELFEALQRMLNDDALARRLSDAARHAAATIWSEETHLSGYLGLIDDLAAQRSRTTARIP